MSGKTIDWDSIEVLYRAGVRSLRDIAKEFGTTESNIRAKAKKMGWVRNPAAVKRERVNARLSGADAQSVAQPIAQAVECAIAQEVEADVEDMERGLRVNRKILQKIETDLESARGFKTYKAAAEAAKTAIDSIRRIRGLDASLDLRKLSDEELEAIARGKMPT